MTLSLIVLLIGCGLAVLGLVFVFHAAISLYMSRSYMKINAQIVDYIQEYTSRGFMWKAKVRYNLDGNDCFYITKAKTRKRGSGIVKLRMNKNGKIVEIDNIISNISFGLFALTIALVVIAVSFSL